MSNTLENKSSSSTLVDPPSRPSLAYRTHQSLSSTPVPEDILPLPSRSVARNGTSDTRSPFSAAFDPNPTPTTSTVPLTTPAIIAANPAHPDAALARSSSMYSRSSSLGSSVAHEQWSQIMSASLSALANQFNTASRAISSIPSPDEIENGIGEAIGSGEGAVTLGSSISLINRIATIEGTQVRLGEELEAVRAELQALKLDATPATHKTTEYISEKALEKAKERSQDLVEEVGRDDLQSRIEALERRVEGVVESIKLDQARLYARLHNASVTLNKQAIKPLAMANGKFPQNFPATKGEFEHVTRERYENILKSYNLPLKGDTAAKREAVREFLGLTPPGK